MTEQACGQDLKHLRHDLDSLFSDTSISNATFGVAIQSLKTGEYLYQLNDAKSLLPASNMKLFTTAEALALLGPEYRYKTELLTNGKIKGNTLYGDLIIRGGGDPSFDATLGLDSQIDSLFGFQWIWTKSGTFPKSKVDRVSGEVIANDSYFTPDAYPIGWQVEDLPFYYAPEVTALSTFDNSYTLIVDPLGQIGEKTEIERGGELEEDTVFIIVKNLTRIKADSMVFHRVGMSDSIVPGYASIEINRKLGTDTFVVTGEMSKGADYLEQNISIPNPTNFAARCLQLHLEKDKGIRFQKHSRIRDSLVATTVLAVDSSKPLSTLVDSMNKTSDNLYAECLFRTVAKEIGGEGSWTRGTQVMRKYLATIGIDTTHIQFTDGSGLSRMDLVTAGDIVKLLRVWYPADLNDSKDGKSNLVNPSSPSRPLSPLDISQQAFYNSLPIMGVDGTLENRLKDTPAQGNVHAKTGSMTGVRSISGYLTTRDGEPVAFSILANNYTCPGSEIGTLEDNVILALVNFSRK